MSEIAFVSEYIYKKDTSSWFAGRACIELEAGDTLLCEYMGNNYTFTIVSIEIMRKEVSMVYAGSACGLNLATDGLLALDVFTKKQFIKVRFVDKASHTKSSQF